MATKNASVNVAPIALISISDHCTRLKTEENKVARGALFGQYVRDKAGQICGVLILDSIEGNDAEGIGTMVGLCQLNYPDQELVGYYYAAPKLDLNKPPAWKFPITGKKAAPEDCEVKATHFPSCYLIWNSTAKGSKTDLGLRIHEMDKAGNVGRSQDFGIHRRKAEVIGLNDVLKLECNRTSLTKLERYQEGIDNLLSRVDVLLKYLDDVSKKKRAPDTVILRNINSLLSRLPLTGGKSNFENDLLDEYSMAQLYGYLGAMTEASAMLGNNHLAVSKTQSRGGFGPSMRFMGGF